MKFPEIQRFLITRSMVHQIINFSFKCLECLVNHHKVERFSRANMSCKSAQRLRRRLYVKHNGNVPNLSDVPNLERTNTQREIIIPKRRTGKLAPIEKHLGIFSKTSIA